MLPTVNVSDLIIALYDANTGALLKRLNGDDDIPAGLLEGHDVTAAVSFKDKNLEDEVGSVRLSLGGDTRVENAAPYALFGDRNGDFFGGKSYDDGDYNLRIQVYSGGNATGSQLLSTNMSFSVVDDAAVAAASTTSAADPGLVVSLMNTATDVAVAELYDGYKVDKADIDGSKMSFVVEAADDDFADQIGSVRLTYGDIVRVENTAPYSMFGDIGTDNFTGGKYLQEGHHSVKIEVFSQPGAKGSLLHSEIIDFHVEDGAESEPSAPAPDPVVVIPDPQPDSDPVSPPPATAEPSVTVTLVNTAKDSTVRTISDGIDITATHDKFSFIVEGDGDFADEIGSVRLTFGDIVKVENAAPYSLFGDTDGDYFGGMSIPSGEQSIKVEVFSGSNATGASLLTETLSFTVKGGTSAAPAPDPVEPDPDIPDPVEPDPVIPDPVEPDPVEPEQPVSASGDTFVGENGRIILEAESGDREGAWQRTNIDGETVMLWDNNTNHYGSPQNGQSLTFNIMPDEDGTYTIGLHSGRSKDAMSAGDAARTDTGNDAYVRVTNVATGEVVLSPTKLFTGLGGSDEVLRWGSTFDINHAKSRSDVQLEANTEYQFELIGRSDGFAVDRITLNKGGLLANENLPESDQGGTQSPAQSPEEPAAPSEPVSPPSSGSTTVVGTDVEFNGIRLWVANDISETDDAAAIANLLIGAKNISESDNNITGSADTLTLEGAYIDTDYNIARDLIDDVQGIANTAASLYGIDIYSPFELFNQNGGIGGNEAAWLNEFEQSLDTAYANGEQLLVISGGPSIASYEVALDWLNSANGADQVNKAIWMLEGGFSQVTHGDTYTSDNVLDYSRDPSTEFFNIKTKTNTNVNESFEQLYDRALTIAENGIGTYYSQAQFNQFDNDFVGDSLLISVENQNRTNSVRGDLDTISDYIDNGFARQQAETYSKDNGNTIDISDVGMLAIIKDDGTSPLDLNDLDQITQDDFLVA